jgi:predicted secreted protein
MGMVEPKADFANITDGNDASPATPAGFGRAVVLAAVVSALLIVALLELLRQLIAHLHQVPSGIQVALLLVLFFLPGVGAGLIGNVRGCGLGTAVGVASGGL